MLEPMKCAAVIPCLNEGVGVAALVMAARRYLPCVIVVDDGSTDDTAALAKAAGATVVRHERNRGKGASLRTGLSLAMAQGFEWTVTLDGDGQHAPEDLPVFLRGAEETGALLVIGNRMNDARAMPWLRRQVNRWMSRKLSQCVGRSLPDTQCGFRLVHLQTWASLPLKTDHFEIESEMLMAFLAAAHPVAFAPVRVVRRRRSSHIHPVTDTLRWWKWWLAFRCSSLQPTKTNTDRRENSPPNSNDSHPPNWQPSNIFFLHSHNAPVVPKSEIPFPATQVR